MRHRDGRDDDDLLDALAGLGAHHEPDTAGMRRRVDELTGGRVVPLGGPRRTRPLLVAAAATGVIATGGWVLLGGGADGPVVSTTTAPPASRPAPSLSGTPTLATVPTPTPTGTSEATSTTRGPATSEPAPDSSTRTTPRPQPPATTRPDGPPAGPYRIGVSAAPGDLVLATPAVSDWVAVGVRADGRLVRAKRPTLGTLLEVGVPDGPLATAPVRTSWSDGVPEQDRTVDTWLELPATSGFTVRVGPSARPLTVRLLLGLRGTTAGVTVLSADGRPGSARGVVSGTGAFTVDVVVPAADAATSIEVTGRGGLGSAALHVGSVTATG